LAKDTFRFLGFAFATADLLFEIDGEGAITFAAGAGLRVTGRDNADLIGRSWQALFDEADQAMGEAFLAGLEDGARRGPVEIQLAPGPDGASRGGSLSLFRLPQNAPTISCALSLSSQRPPMRRPGLCDRGQFETLARDAVEATRNGGPELELGLIEFAGLVEHRGQLSEDDAGALDRRLEGALRAEAYSDLATDLGDQRFALLRRKGDAPETVARRLSRVLGAALAPTAYAVSVDAANPTRMIRALRFALDSFLADGTPPPEATLSEVLDRSMRRTVAEASAFGDMVRQGRFRLVYQPVVSLGGGAVHHYEALVRFDGDRSPFAMIRMAEELDIIEELDLAVAEQAAARIRADPDGALRLAVNVSGRTIVSANFMEAITRLAAPGDLADRLMFEITETAAIGDLALARRHIEALQALTLKVCLDDFGSGAASFAYLQQLPVDVVKIDGSYVRELTSSGRDDALIRHLVGLCRELGVSTVAEMVETFEIETVLRRAGVDYAQGWLYGQPTSEPLPKPVVAAVSPPVVRRLGAVEQWG
jgi:EAL domain-containing protein (putative c-di-GMP-specific phosphodiesterase class I)